MLCLLALTPVAMGCGEGTSTAADGGSMNEEAKREGLDAELDGVIYNVFITRQLNLRDAEDQGYRAGTEAPPGFVLYGVFIQACNREEKEPRKTAASFVVTDTQGNEYEPRELEEDNTFAYHPRELGKGDCIPEADSLAASGPTAGSLLVFELPLEAVENRPLELEIVGGYDLTQRKQRTTKIELDI